MAMHAAVVGAACSAVLSLTAACGDDTTRGGPSSTPGPAESPTSAGTPTGTKSSQKPQLSPFCTEVARQVQATYHLMSQPTSAGQDLWMSLTVQNRTSRTLLVEFAGVAGVDAYNPGSGPLLNWGGSSADLISVPAASDRTYRVASAGPSPLSIPADATVFGVGGYAHATAPRGRGACFAPARVVAPPGLVDGHPEGTWDLPPGPSFGVQNAIVRKACGPPSFTGPPGC